MNLGSHVVTNPLQLRKIPCGSTAKNEDNNRYKRAMVTTFLAGTKLLVLNILPRKQIFNQNHFLTMITPELSNENPDAKGRVHKNQLIVHTYKSICCHERKIREYFARKTAMRAQFIHQVCHPLAFDSSALQRNE
jgi:hypothetical protein